MNFEHGEQGHPPMNGPCSNKPVNRRESAFKRGREPHASARGCDGWHAKSRLLERSPALTPGVKCTQTLPQASLWGSRIDVIIGLERFFAAFPARGLIRIGFREGARAAEPVIVTHLAVGRAAHGTVGAETFPVHAVYAYQRQRHGDGAFAEACQEQFGGLCFRHVNDRDMAPGVPPHPLFRPSRMELVFGPWDTRSSTLIGPQKRAPNRLPNTFRTAMPPSLPPR